MIAPAPFIYKICSAELWQQAEEEGFFAAQKLICRWLYPFLGSRTGKGNGRKTLCRPGWAGAGLCSNRGAGAGLGAIGAGLCSRISMERWI